MPRGRRKEGRKTEGRKDSESLHNFFKRVVERMEGKRQGRKIRRKVGQEAREIVRGTGLEERLQG